MKAIWNGTLSFGLVTIPVHLVGAIKRHSLGFKLLCKTCKNPIVYERWCKHCKKEVAWNDIIKGLELPDGTLFTITHEKLKALKPLKSDKLIIHEFVPKEQLELLYGDEHYYLIPSPQSERAYLLLYKAIVETERIAIATFIMREKEHLCAITPYKSILLITTLHYAYEIQPVPLQIKPALFNSPEIRKELSLARDLVTKFSSDRFNLNKYKDTFAQRLLAAIKENKHKKKGTTKIKAKKEPGIVATKSTLAHALKASLKAAGTKRKRMQA